MPQTKLLTILSWFESPLHPEGTDLERFHYTPGCCPEAERAAREVVNLPTHGKIGMGEAERVVGFLKNYAKSVSYDIIYHRT